jgi:hypothetical protein
MEFKEGQNLRRVMIATPCQYGQTSIYYNNSLNYTRDFCAANGIVSFPIYLGYDALIQRARNDLFAMAYESGVDDVVWIDSDQDWNPEDFLKLLNHPVDVVGGCSRKKTDNVEIYNIRFKGLEDPFKRDADTGLIEVNGIGCAFLRMTKRAIHTVWNATEPYISSEKEAHWIFDVRPVNGELVSEDNFMCEKLREAGIKIWFDPSITVAHTGDKRFVGNFLEYEKKVIETMKKNK